MQYTVTILLVDQNYSMSTEIVSSLEIAESRKTEVINEIKELYSDTNIKGSVGVGYTEITSRDNKLISKIAISQHQSTSTQ